MYGTKRHTKQKKTTVWFGIKVCESTVKQIVRSLLLKLNWIGVWTKHFFFILIPKPTLSIYSIMRMHFQWSHIKKKKKISTVSVFNKNDLSGPFRFAIRLQYVFYAIPALIPDIKSIRIIFLQEQTLLRYFDPIFRGKLCVKWNTFKRFFVKVKHPLRMWPWENLARFFVVFFCFCGSWCILFCVD